MSKFYAFIWDGISISKGKIAAEFSSGPSIFVPFASSSRHDNVVSGIFVSPEEVYWHDPTGCVDRTKELLSRSENETNHILSKTLSHIYPGLHDFFVNDCGVHRMPSFRGYLQILLQLSSIAPPSQAANAVFQVLLKWAMDLNSGSVESEDIIYMKEYLLKLENTVLPTVHDKWVSLHPSYGLVCWSDDKALGRQFKHFDNIHFLYFGKLSDDKKEMIPVKLSALMQTVGIPALSEVVTREAIFEGTEDCHNKALLMNWVLPYAQRYIFKLHPDTYYQLKESGFENLSLLKVVVVENLFYRHTIKGSENASKKRFECSCLLQENILYMTKASDSHSIFLEFSRVFFNGTPKLEFANFLHMITTMVESGSTEEQVEFFILNSQKVPQLPDEECTWFLPFFWSLPPQENDKTPQTISDSEISNEEKMPSKPKSKSGISPIWPPQDWRTAPGFNYLSKNLFWNKPAFPKPYTSTQWDQNKGMPTYPEQNRIPFGINIDWIIQNNLAAATSSFFPRDSIIGNQPLLMGNSGSVSTSNAGDRLSFTVRDEVQSKLTGKLGEQLAFKYFIENYGEEVVRWVNKETETGLPYDLILREKDVNAEYIEVKATKSSSRDWFEITTREWQFAVTKGESFSIAHVVIAGTEIGKIQVFKNPLRLCQQRKLQLALLMRQ